MGTVGALSCPVGQGRFGTRQKALGVETPLRWNGRLGCYRELDRGHQCVPLGGALQRLLGTAAWTGTSAGQGT